ncbi:aldehyde dehydrogenase family protein [Tumebacillus permanentifrigoris]|uniref:Aldehyde dehydrogenase n=1 Tax=Tumebacillus permanentifrigoris TaxID=378543 RepID=A0A316DYS9_9BACL|nr:aldehyde dehydrogenase family protein [Tumebacillus permanentifrigoris]PWK15660.1 acyl-CoA reductase-like NAD-dependent aldehyde dehydrogenase [Tumebacillus permanentifrigoris]
MNNLTQINPATGETIEIVPEMNADEINAAVERARSASHDWMNTPLHERLGHMKRLREYISDHVEEIANNLAAYTGKVYTEAVLLEIFPVVDLLDYYEKNASKILSSQKVKTPIVFFGNHSYLEYKPMGVVAVIAPWNFPFLLSVSPVLSALIAGNCVLLKPSEITPMAGVLIEKMFQAIGLPDGVFQVVHGGREAGRLLTESRPDKIFFTGSVATGRKIMAAAAEHLIPVELELGGKDPLIVFADADLERAANGAVWGAFANAGQVCMSVERVYVEASVYDKFLSLVKAKTTAMRRGVDYGSMTFPPQMEIVQEHLRDAVERGAQIVCGGQPAGDGTLYFEPTVVTGVDHSMKLMMDETFGPVLPIMTFQSEEEATRLANATIYGLNASVFTRDLDKAKRVTRQLVSGNVCINEVVTSVANPHLPFGGVKQSGMGRYHGPNGLHTFSHQTSVMASPGKKPREISWHPYTPKREEAIGALTRLFYGRSRTEALKSWRAILSEFLGTYRR